MGSFNEVVGYTVTGAVILRASERQDYLVLYPLRRGSNAKNYGHFSSLKQFEADILQEKNFASSCLHPIKPDDIPILKKRLGSLGKEQAYFPVPNTWMGGSWDLKSFDKGNVWIFVLAIRLGLGLGLGLNPSPNVRFEGKSRHWFSPPTFKLPRFPKT